MKFGFEVQPSVANFVFAHHSQHDAAVFAIALREHGVIVRYFKQARIEQHLRITVGTEQQDEALLGALRYILV